MSEKDFIIKKKEIQEKIDAIDNELQSIIQQIGYQEINSNPFIDMLAKHTFINLEIHNKLNIDYRKLLDTIGVELLSDFVHSVIDHIIIKDKRVESITFKNGMTHIFVYKPEEKRKARPRQRMLYQKYEDVVIEYLKQNGMAQRKDIEEITGLNRFSATTLLNDLMARDIIERKGNSVGIRYFLKRVSGEK